MAIAFVTSVQTANSGSSASVSLTVSGSNTILVVGVAANASGASITSVKYNSVNMTLARADGPAHNQIVALYYMVNPPAGAHNIDVVFGGSVSYAVMGSLYSGAAQSGQPDATGGTTHGTADGNTATNDVTTVAANCWHIAVTGNEGGTPAAGTNTTNRESGGGYALSDNNAAIVSPGTDTLNWGWGPGNNAPWCSSGMSIAPATSITISVTDSLSLTESTTPLELFFININDTLTTTESVTITNTNCPRSVSDSLTITESVSIANVYNISVFDAESLTESVTITNTGPNASVFDSLTITESVTVRNTNAPASVSDSIALAESVVTALIDFEGINDTITVAESVTISSSIGGISLADSVALTESVTTFSIRGGTPDPNNVPRGAGLAGSGIMSAQTLGYSL